MPIYGKCDKCGNATKDYFCSSCRIVELLAELAEATARAEKAERELAGLRQTYEVLEKSARNIVRQDDYRAYSRWTVLLKDAIAALDQQR